MHGYIFSIQESCKYPFRFENVYITIYNRDAISINNTEKYNINLNSDLKYLVAEDIDTNKTLIFFVRDIPFESSNWDFVSSERIKVNYYLELKILFHDLSFNKLIFEFPELNYFYPIINGFNSENNESYLFSINPIPFQQTKQCFSFKINGNKFDIEFGVSGAYRFRNSAPLTFSSQLSCSFQKTNNFNIIIEIYTLVKRLFYFLCHRRSICLTPIIVRCISKNDKYTVGNLYILFDNKKAENEDIVKETICINLVKSNFNQLIQLIADDCIYTENIPRDYESAHRITTASFILEAAAFEWSYKKLYGMIKLSDYRLAVKQDIIKVINTLKDNNDYNSKENRELKYYSKIIKKTESNFSERVIFALRDFDSVLSKFIQRIYKYNNVKYDKKTYSKIANELQKYRNSFAHGDIDNKIKGQFILDTIILEWLNYCIILKTAGYTHDEIFNIINTIFHQSFINREIE